MATRFSKAFAACALSASVLFASTNAHATLGQDVASIAANEHALGATRQVTKLASGERHDLVLPSGMTVHQYVSAAGAVYAITWSGPHAPNLREFLGAYFAQLSSRASQGGHHLFNFVGSDVVVRAMAHGHSFLGRAWVPSLVPVGLQVETAIQQDCR